MEQGSAREGVRPPYAPGAPAGTPVTGRVPEQLCVGRSQDAERAGGARGARGEHTHGEPPAPVSSVTPSGARSWRPCAPRSSTGS